MSRKDGVTERILGQDRFLTEEMRDVISGVEGELGNDSISQNIHFSTGVINRLERQLTLGCTLVTDTNLLISMLDRSACGKLPVRLACYIDDPFVVSVASQRQVTRAEIAAEMALSQPGSKIFLVGSAPKALDQVLLAQKRSPLVDVTVIAAASGFASAVAIKERLWESGIPCIVVRGKAGGPPAATAIANTLLRAAAARAK